MLKKIKIFKKIKSQLPSKKINFIETLRSTIKIKNIIPKEEKRMPSFDYEDEWELYI